jgi:biotin carboxyl carrier protein
MKWVVRGSAKEREVEVERSASGFEVEVDGQRHDVELVRFDGTVASLRFVEDGRSFHVSYDKGDNRHWRIGVVDREFTFEVLTPVEAIDASVGGAGGGASVVTAPIPGKVVAVKVAVGDEVEVGQSLVVLEAMKMENELTAEQSGKVSAIHAEAGDTVDTGSVLVELQ